MTHPKPDNAPLACFICGKQKGQPPERCNGHYDNAPTPMGPVMSASDIEKRGELNDSRWVAEIITSHEALRDLLAQRDKRVEELEHKLEFACAGMNPQDESDLWARYDAAMKEPA